VKVCELAEELKTSDEFVLGTLKSLKLKSKDSQQELNAVVLSVLKGAISKIGKLPPRTAVEKKVNPVRKKKAGVSEESVKAVEVKKETEEPKKKKTVVKKRKTVKSKNAESLIEEKKTEAKTSEVKKEPAKKKPILKEEVVEKPKVKPKSSSKISKAPMIMLKPLARKKRKSISQKEKAEETVTEEKLVVLDKPSEQTEVPEEKSKEPTLARDESLPDIEINVPISVKDLSGKLQEKPSLVLKKLMQMGILCHINQNLDADIVSHLTREFGFNYAKIRTQEEQLIEDHKQEDEDPKLLKPRAPVVTFMGHVDHGKTSLLDKIRKSKVADVEHGGITQHMSAYSVEIPKGRITFLDTPGHAAFTAMRARGAHITDLVVLVVAADEGIMPQTREAIDHARAANVSIVVALNKMDRPNADPDRVKQQLAEVDLAPEDWGGKTVVAPVSAMTGEGIDELLELILLEAELLELKANTEKKASGLIVEAHLSQGRGAVTTAIVQSGTLNDNDVVVVGPYYCKIRAMFNDRHQIISKAGPSMPVEMIGLSDVPEAGDSFYVVEDERTAKEISMKRQEELKNKKLHVAQKITLENLYSQLEEGVKELNVIMKSDVQGSLEALKDSLEKIPSDKVKIKFIHLGVGDINASDVVLAVASKAIIIAFHVGTGPRAKEELKKTPVDIREYRIIYDAVDDMRKALEGLLEAKTKKNFLSRIEIREVFKLSKQGIVAGCYVEKGKVHRKASIDIIRNEETVFSGTIGSLKRFKDDVREVSEGMECGITINGFDKIQSGDIIEAYDLETIVQKL